MKYINGTITVLALAAIATYSPGDQSGGFTAALLALCAAAALTVSQKDTITSFKYLRSSKGIAHALALLLVIGSAWFWLVDENGGNQLSTFAGLGIATLASLFLVGLFIWAFATATQSTKED